MSDESMPAIERKTYPIDHLANKLATGIGAGRRLGLMTARKSGDGDPLVLVALLIDLVTGGLRLIEAPMRPGDNTYSSVTARVPQAHWFERSIRDFFGLTPAGHPRLKSVLLHEAWPQGFYPLAATSPQAPLRDTQARAYDFLQVKGEGVYEIPVGPIHAGIIEPGHFRFSCLGETIQNLEIRLGYQHRGIEERLQRTPWRRIPPFAEAISGDTTVGNALAHALAIEQLTGVAVPPAAAALRAAALEIERIASHIGDLGGLAGDIGFLGPAALFARQRGRALGLGERLTGSRFQSAFIRPGGVTRPLSEEMRRSILADVIAFAADFDEARRLLTDEPGAVERMENVGVVRPSLARDFGLVGPAGRASGQGYDVRAALRQPPYDVLDWTPAGSETGDVLARAMIRIQEVATSFDLLHQLLSTPLVDFEIMTTLPDTLPANAVGAGVVEAWRGELIHLAITDANGGLLRYAVKDPSFNNWTGLAIAARLELVADFPLCNKSFGLSYSGNDL
ncbi:MAG: NADH-quinone oxidoreductase subunit C [Capsulimonadaceae bacterium]|nr:NADH-quinone oxidoreductase subunit C [Capsulimonadaceae bacterium]